MLFGNEAVKVVPGQLLEMDDTPKFIPGKTIESAMGSVAQEALGASVEPMRPEVTTRAVEVAPKIACEAASTMALRRAFASSKAKPSAVTQ